MQKHLNKQDHEIHEKFIVINDNVDETRLMIEQREADMRTSMEWDDEVIKTLTESNSISEVSSMFVVSINTYVYLISRLT